ncbi:MAG TPA: TIGR01777 family oxidoreductase, partial [Candidatus Bathyarchaeia archaeon]|nr:TIGR01777 family oxidoreductase [Candidatus Bathyarchaeia archaeon]
MEYYLHRSRVDVPPIELFQWHAKEGALERLNPPWLPFNLIDKNGGLRDGTVEIAMRFTPFLNSKWLIKHLDTEYIEGKRFVDTQIKGPFSHWKHTHDIIPYGNSSSLLEDRIEYRLPLGKIGRLVARKIVTKNLEEIFQYRHSIVKQDTDIHCTLIKKNNPLIIAITGSTGFIGSSLVPFLTTGGHKVIRLLRRTSKINRKTIREFAYWEPNKLSSQFLSGVDINAVVNLAGENIEGRWTKQKKKRILDSRIQTTKSLCESLVCLDRPPEVLVSASAVGYYGDMGDQVLSEESNPGDGFFPEVCREWEEATEKAKSSGIRVLNIRIGLVLSSSGGILRRILGPFKMGLGGRIGSGTQYISWIALDDLLGIVLHTISNKSVSGALNAVSPNPITNRDFTRILGNVLSRPTLISIPRFAARMAFGELTDAALLSSVRVLPIKLLRSGYQFRFPKIEQALRHT